MKNTKRDPTLFVMLFLPLLMLAALRFGLQPLIDLAPEVVDYQGLIIIFFAVLSAMFPSYIISFMLLDERDQHVLEAFRVMPLNVAGYFGMRMIYMFLFGLVNGFIILKFNGAMEVSSIKCILLSFVASTCSPLFVFLTISLAKNKIEGATMMKVLNVLLMLPFLAFFIDSPATYVLGVIPFYWIYMAFEKIDSTGYFMLFTGIGFILAISLNLVLYRLALRRFYLR